MTRRISFLTFVTRVIRAEYPITAAGFARFCFRCTPRWDLVRVHSQRFLPFVIDHPVSSHDEHAPDGVVHVRVEHLLYPYEVRQEGIEFVKALPEARVRGGVFDAQEIADVLQPVGD